MLSQKWGKLFVEIRQKNKASNVWRLYNVLYLSKGNRKRLCARVRERFTSP